MTTLAQIQTHLGIPADGKLGPQTLAAIALALGVQNAPASTHKLADPAKFFAAVRQITGPLDTVQVDTINRLLTSAAHWPLSWLAYGLATAWHEARFKPQPEWGRGKGKPYGVPHKYKQAPYGRGLVQLTHDFNYEWADEAASAAGLIKKGELLADFDKALEPELAAFILVKGMEEGAFTKRKLADALPDRRATHGQFVKGRPIINGTDKADLIAGYAEGFQSALEAGGWS